MRQYFKILLICFVSSYCVFSAYAAQAQDDIALAEQEFYKTFGQLKTQVTPRPQDNKANQIAQKQLEGKNAPMPTQGKNGSVQFQFDSSTPRIWCKPLRVTDIELEPGEAVVNTPFVGDGTNWAVMPSASGSGDKLTYHIIIKPKMPDLETNLIVHTDRRTYQFDLVSSNKMYTPHVTFSYPMDSDGSWENFFSAMGDNDPRKLLVGNRTEEMNGTQLPLPRNGSQQPVKRQQQHDYSKGFSPNQVAIPTASSRLNFNYKIVTKGKNIPWKPLRAYDNGLKTYIDMPDNLPAIEAPVFMVVSPAGTREMVNYRLVDRTYVIDRLIQRGVLMAGVGGDAQEVGIINKGGSSSTQSTKTESGKKMNKAALVDLLVGNEKKQKQLQETEDEQ